MQAQSGQEMKVRANRGADIVNNVWTGWPSSAPNSIACSRKQSVTIGREMCITIGLRTCGTAMPFPSAVEPSDSRAKSTWTRTADPPVRAAA